MPDVYADLQINYLKDMDPEIASILGEEDQVSGPETRGIEPVVWNCINILTSALTAMPFEVVEKSPKGDFKKIDHDVQAVLDNPSNIMDPHQHYELFIRNYISSGNAYNLILRDGAHVDKLVNCLAWPRLVGHSYRTLRRVYNVPRISYVLDRDEGPLSDREILALHNDAFDGLVAPSPITAAAKKTINLLKAGRLHNQNSIDRGMTGRAVLVMDPALVAVTKDQRTEIRQDLEEKYQGARNAGKVPVLPPGVAPGQMGGVSSVDLQLVELLKWSIEDICRVFDVPPRMVHHQHVGIRVDPKLSQLSSYFVRWSVLRHARRLSAQMTYKLLPVRDIKAKRYIRMNPDMIVAGTFEEKVVAVGSAVAQYGLLTINEGRKFLGYEPHDDGDILISPIGAPPTGEGNGDDSGTNEGDDSSKSAVLRG